jgi:hypothetical protein
MKKVRDKFKLYFIAIVAGVVSISGCNKEVTPEVSEHDKQVELLANTWTVKGEANSVTLNGADENMYWPSFQITFTKEKTYSATNISAERNGTVWSPSGTWDFKSATDLSTIVRDDGTEIDIVVDPASLTMSFDYVVPGGRLSGIGGAWIFKMQPAQ